MWPIINNRYQLESKIEEFEDYGICKGREKCGGTDGARPACRSEIPEAAVETDQLVAREVPMAQ